MVDGLFAEVEPLVRAGRYREAVRALKRSVAAGSQRWEVLIWMGRISENQGRLEEAEESFRKALAAAPDSTSPRIELVRILEKNGNPAEAMRIMREAASRASGELELLAQGLLREDQRRASAERLFALMEFNLYRRVFVSEVIEKQADLGRVEAVMRAMLRESPRAGARTLLAQILIAQGRLSEAEEELSAAFLPGAAGVEASRLEVLLELIGRGSYHPRLERRVAACLSEAGTSEKLVIEWPEIFAALMCARRYDAAFRLGETMLDRLGSFGAPQHLLWPWWRKVGRAVSEHRFLAEELERMRAASRGAGRLRRWYSYYRAVLLGDMGRFRQAMAECERIPGLRSARYCWMSQSFVLVKLDLLDFDGASAICRAVLKRAPSHWWVRCRMAEAFLAKGDVRAGLREFSLAERARDQVSRREVLTWHGEVLLWLGEYEEAREKLDEAVSLGAKTFAFGWRGAARLKSGDGAGALADLDRAVALDPKDFEARAWRGEAYRLMGRFDEAAADLDASMRSPSESLWVHFNRGLLRAAMGDAKGLAADFGAIPGQMTGLIARKLGIPGGAAVSADEMIRVLEEGLESARGIRRWEAYVLCIWRSRFP